MTQEHKYTTETQVPPPPIHSGPTGRWPKSSGPVQSAMKKLRDGTATYIQSEKLSKIKHGNVRSSYHRAAKSIGIRVKTYITDDGRVIAVLAEGGAE